MTAPFIILADTREQAIPPMPAGVQVERAKLGEGDYTTPSLRTLAVIERKSGNDFASSLTWQRERFDREIERLKAYRHASIVVEADLSEVYRLSNVHPHAILGSIASFYARANVATFFAVNAAGCGRLIAGILRRLDEDRAANAREKGAGA
jgi:ERCC4-type nuclease